MLDRAARDQRLLRRLAEAEGGAGPALTAPERARALALRDALARALHADDLRRSEDLADRTVPDALPPHRDWSWRPSLWRAPVVPCGWAASGSETALSAEATLFHDCPLGEIAARQVRGGGPPFALAVDVYGFRGSYLSLAVDLPAAARAGLRRRHVLRFDTRIRTERAGTVYARLNLLRGSAPASIVREVPLDAGHDGFVDFDLAGLKMDVTRAERLWIDLIFDGRSANAILVEDLFLSRMPRAEL